MEYTQPESSTMISPFSIGDQVRVRVTGDVYNSTGSRLTVKQAIVLESPSQFGTVHVLVLDVKEPYELSVDPRHIIEKQDRLSLEELLTHKLDIVRHIVVSDY